MFIGDFVSDLIEYSRNFILERNTREDISDFIHRLLVLLMIVFFNIYCDLSNYRSLVNHFNKYDSFC